MDGDAVQPVPVHIAARSAPAEGPTPWCRAPGGHLYLAPWGEVRACCQHLRPLGHVPDQRLIEIWRSAERARLVEAVHGGDLSLGCQTCQGEAGIEGRAAAYAAVFDVLPETPLEGWPSFIEFNLSNRCNLQCVQCNHELSSAIRSRQTDLPPIPQAYGEEFFEDLELFLPHLQRAQFAGGEPFLASENYRVWDLIARIAPHVECTVVTNATIWNDRVEGALAALPLNIVLSIDGITRSTYEAIRVGASFDRVLENIERFHRYTSDVGTTLSINHCLMVQNHHEFGDLLVFAEERGIPVDVSVVRGPEECALGCLPEEALRTAVDTLASREVELAGKLLLNRPTWERELDRLRSMAAAAEAARTAAFKETRYNRELAFTPAASPPEERGALRDELEAFAEGGPVVELLIVREVIRWTSPEVHGILGLPEGALLGKEPNAFAAEVAGAFGAQIDETFERGADDRIDITARHERATVKVIVVPADRGAMSFLIGIRWLPDAAVPSAGADAI